jgi:hypothetical protein
MQLNGLADLQMWLWLWLWLKQVLYDVCKNFFFCHNFHSPLQIIHTLRRSILDEVDIGL